MYEARFGAGGACRLGDVRDTEAVVSSIRGAPFLATASFPCTDLSLAGRRRGLRGTQSSAFFGFVNALRALAAHRPTLVLIENVPGFITANSGWEFATALRAIAKLGYWIDAFVLDAKHFVPQSRPRVFIVGLHRRALAAVAPVRSSPDAFARWRRSIEQRAPALRPPALVWQMRTTSLATGWLALDLPTPKLQRQTLGDVIDTYNAQAWWDAAAVAKHRGMMSGRHRKTIDLLRAQGGVHVATMYRRTRHGRVRAELRTDGLAGCLRTPSGGSSRQIVVVVDEQRVRMRWMSPREYARLQGADDFPLAANDRQNLQAFGDAVCAPAIAWIDGHVLTPLYESIA